MARDGPELFDTSGLKDEAGEACDDDGASAASAAQTLSELSVNPSFAFPPNWGGDSLLSPPNSGGGGALGPT